MLVSFSKVLTAGSRWVMPPKGGTGGVKATRQSTYLLSNSSQRAIQEVLRAKTDLRVSLDARAWTKMSVIG